VLGEGGGILADDDRKPVLSSDYESAASWAVPAGGTFRRVMRASIRAHQVVLRIEVSALTIFMLRCDRIPVILNPLTTVGR
jgi:hypothetical protein